MSLKKMFICTLAIPIFLLGMLTSAGLQKVWAHTTPTDFNDTGVTISLKALRDTDNNGVGDTPISPLEVIQGETIYYQCTLTRNDPNVAFELGSTIITTPDASDVDVTPMGGIPCICGSTGDGCTNDPNPQTPPRGLCENTPPSITFEQVPYTVDCDDVGVVQENVDKLRAICSYSDGYAHIGTNDTSPISAETPYDLDCSTCEVKVDKQVSCNGVDWIDPGLVVANDDGTFDCIGIVGETLMVRYQAENSGTGGVHNCTISESNSLIGPTVDVGDINAGDTTQWYVDDDQVCSETLDDQEPNTATLDCFCTEDLNPEFMASAYDEASFLCQTCEVKVDKQVSCNGVDWIDPGLVVANNDGTFNCNGIMGETIYVRYQAENSGTADVYNCTISESNPLIGPAVNVGNINAGDTTPFVTDADQVCSEELDDQEPNTATLDCFCTEDQDPELMASAYDEASFVCQTCQVMVDKQVSCNGVDWIDPGLVVANDDGTFNCIGIVGETLMVRYQAHNPGSAVLYNCDMSESNPSIGTGPGPIGDILPGDTTPFFEDNDQDCSETLDDQEPNTVTVDCFCTEDLDPDLKTVAYDTADFECQIIDLNVTKICDPQEDDTNNITITVENTGTADLVDCVVTDEIFLDDSDCPADVGSGTPVTVDPSGFDLDHGQTQIVTGTVTGLTADACNDVSVTCDVAEIGGQITVDADDVCEAGKGCLTRTPGFWATHPHITALYLPLDSCGLTIDQTDAETPYSATEDMCSVGTDRKAYDTSPQQVQLIRQCMAANLNIAATLEGGGNCESEHTGLASLMERCCDGLCNSGARPCDIDMTGCIEDLDNFNNSPDTLIFEPFIHPGPADPTDCDNSKNNDWMNPGRNLGPEKCTAAPIGLRGLMRGLSR